MSRKKQLIIPIFIPFGGCPNQCVFCDQKGITGRAEAPAPQEAVAIIRKYLSTWKGSGRKEAAFYGGSFTALPVETQDEYLRAAGLFFKSGKIDGIRVSTRPDCVSPEALDRLKGFGVDTVELGIQSMSEEVLRLSGRGHSPEAAVLATGLLRKHRFVVGHQIMPGLPGDTKNSIMATVFSVIALKPDFVRVYPALVLKDTPLHRMYLDGRYTPWALDDMIEVCRRITVLFRDAGIPIIRMGLHGDSELEASLVSGPWHPSFRNLVESGIPASS